MKILAGSSACVFMALCIALRRRQERRKSRCRSTGRCNSGVPTAGTLRRRDRGLRSRQDRDRCLRTGSSLGARVSPRRRFFWSQSGPDGSDYSRARFGAQPVLDLTSTVVSALDDSEGGLMDVVLHPDFATNRHFYLFRSIAASGDTVKSQVVRYELASDAASATEDAVILDDIPATPFHQGGRMRFGPDGMLYVAVGSDDPTPGAAHASQQTTGLAGKILRITPDGDVPSDNPWSGSAAFVIGVRNPQGLDWNANGDLIVTDHGPTFVDGAVPSVTGQDEVNVASSGANLGWPVTYGCAEAAGMTSPALVWEDGVPPGGAAFYTGTAISDWTGDLFIGVLGFSKGSSDKTGRHLHRVSFDASDPTKVSSHEVYLKGDAPDGFGRLRTVIMGPDGHLYVTTSNCDGRGTCGTDKDVVLRVTAP